MVWEILPEWIQEFLLRFIAKPGGGSGGLPWSVEQIIRCESTHFLFSLFLGWLAYCSILTILLSSNYKWSDRSIYHTGLSVGLFVSASTHIIIDGFTTLA